MEFVYTVPRERLFPDCYPHGLLRFGDGYSCEQFLSAVAQHGFFVERAYAERNVSLKQVIPYAVVCSGERVLLTRRTRRGGEARLFDKLSIGIGGHVEPIDLENARLRDPAEGAAGSRAGAIEAATRRELLEEVFLEGRFDILPVGILNDDSNPVGAVHVGLVQRVQVDGDVRVRERDQLDGELVPASELRRLLHGGADFESWSELLVGRIDEILPSPTVLPSKQGRPVPNLQR